MWMTLRALLVPLMFCCLLPLAANATGYKGPLEPDEFAWRNPGALPNQDGPAKSFEMLFADLRINGQPVPDIDRPALEKLKQKVTAGTWDWQEDLPLVDESDPDEAKRVHPMRFTRMKFGNTMAPNVAAVTNTPNWRGKSRKVDVYRVQGASGFVYVMVRPHICGNWALQVFILQQVCVKDEVLCAQGCPKALQELKRVISAPGR